MHPRIALDRRRLAVALALLAAFVLLTFVDKELGTARFDHLCNRVSDAVAGGALVHPLFDAIELLGEPELSSVIAIILAAVVARRHGLLAGGGVLAAFAGLAAIEGLLRIRLDTLPWDRLGEFVRHPRGWHLVHSTYPSGHVGRLALLAAIGAAAFGSRSLVAWGVVAVLTVAISLQRVESRSHVGADVVGGALLAWGLAALWAAACERENSR